MCLKLDITPLKQAWRRLLTLRDCGTIFISRVPVSDSVIETNTIQDDLLICFSENQFAAENWQLCCVQRVSELYERTSECQQRRWKIN